ncbi:hypothetical protein RHSIM_RhsimUnG0197600 [Rhododendron simsii]|uniref:UspA domain-containing protein n=1 Tax=Rhododendron simsii TaxID=118357 RepID=A0A834FU51_RHOSS|nr:hypothetical protein RHSIM_RhsimUnG0197600 [Rhododendron simsii]
MNPKPDQPNLAPVLPAITPTAGAQRRIAIAVDLSDESAYAVKWAVQNYLRENDAVILLHVRPTSVLYGADWGSTLAEPLLSPSPSEESKQKLEDDFDNFTNTKTDDLARPLVDAHIPYKIHIVKDHDMKERLCLEVERLGLSAVIMGSRGFGATRRNGKGRLGSVSDYCVHHCVCPVVVVRYPDGKDGGDGEEGVGEEVDQLHPVPEEEMEYHDADDEQKGAITLYYIVYLHVSSVAITIYCFKIDAAGHQESRFVSRKEIQECDEICERKGEEKVMKVESTGQGGDVCVT